jgi:hypothetical protein
MHVMSVRGLLMTQALLSADGHYALLRCSSAPGFSDVNHPSICTTERRRPWSLRPQALSERSEPCHTGRQSLECLERRGCGAVSRTHKINPYSGTECVVVASRRASAGARVSMGQHKLVRARGNREVSEVADVKDEGQISKLIISRPEGHGLLQNTGGATAGVPNAWRLTARGGEVLSASRPHGRGSGGAGASR